MTADSRITSSFLPFVLAPYLLGIGCSMASTRDDSPQNAEGAFFQAHIEQLRRQGGEDEVSRMLALELEQGSLRERWCCTALQYLRENGVGDALSAIDKLLRLPSDTTWGQPAKWPSTTMRALASEAWYLANEGECRTKREKLQFLRAILDPLLVVPPLSPNAEFTQNVMRSLLPESREVAYEVLADPARAYFEETPTPRVFLEATLSLPEFSPTEEERRAILSRGGTLGRILLLQKMRATPEAKACWQELTRHGDPRVRNMAYQNLVVLDLPECRALRDYLAFLRLQWVTVWDEELKHEGMVLLDCLARRYEIPDIREYAAAFLAEQPELRLKDLANLWDPPMDEIDQFADNVGRLARYRKKARETAQSILDNWGKWREERSAPRMEGETRIRWFLDGKELPRNEQGPGGGDL